MLTRAEALFDHMARLGRPTPELQRQKAWMLIEFARNYAILGDTTKQRQRAEEAKPHHGGAAVERRDDIAVQHVLATAHDEQGVSYRLRATCQRRWRAIAPALPIRERLAKADPGNASWQHASRFA